MEEYRWKDRVEASWECEEVARRLENGRKQGELSFLALLSATRSVFFLDLLTSELTYPIHHFSLVLALRRQTIHPSRTSLLQRTGPTSILSLDAPPPSQPSSNPHPSRTVLNSSSGRQQSHSTPPNLSHLSPTHLRVSRRLPPEGPSSSLVLALLSSSLGGSPGRLHPLPRSLPLVGGSSSRTRSVGNATPGRENGEVRHPLALSLVVKVDESKARRRRFRRTSRGFAVEEDPREGFSRRSRNRRWREARSSNDASSPRRRDPPRVQSSRNRLQIRYHQRSQPHQSQPLHQQTRTRNPSSSLIPTRLQVSRSAGTRQSDQLSPRRSRRCSSFHLRRARSSVLLVPRVTGSGSRSLGSHRLRCSRSRLDLQRVWTGNEGTAGGFVDGFGLNAVDQRRDIGSVHSELAYQPFLFRERDGDEP